MAYISKEKAFHIISTHDLHQINLAELMAIEEVLLEIRQTTPLSEHDMLIQEFLAYMQLRKSESWMWMFFCLQHKALNKGKHKLGNTGLKYSPPQLEHYSQTL